MPTITVTTANGEHVKIPANADLTLAQNIYAAGLWPPRAMCSGMGKCGLCRVRHLHDAPAPTRAEAKRLPEAQLVDGMRLACQHPPTDGMQVKLPALRRPPQKTTQAQKPVACGIGIDLGTTSIHWQGVTPDGEFLPPTSTINPQMGFGAEIMSRLAFAATDSSGLLNRLAVDTMSSIVESYSGVERICVAGNSAMTYLLTGLDAAGIAHAPYHLNNTFGREVTLAQHLPPCFIPPLLAPFVGADLSAGIIGLEDHTGNLPPAPWLLADMGTNGEFVLALPDGRFLLASVPMGPALEGVGLRFGRMAVEGVVTRFTLGGVADRFDRNPAPLTPHVLGGGTPREALGISGTGYLSAVAALNRAGVVAEDGTFATPTTGMGARIGRHLVETSGKERAFPLLHTSEEAMTITASDVEDLLKVKTAFNLAVSALLQAAELPARDVRQFYLAGAFGEHVAPTDLTQLGFLPSDSESRVQAVGNTSLAGARTFVHPTRGQAARQRALALPERCTLLELAAAPTFDADFLARMRFAYL